MKFAFKVLRNVTQKQQFHFNDFLTIEYNHSREF